jgi:hypothetical protein
MRRSWRIFSFVVGHALKWVRRGHRHGHADDCDCARELAKLCVDNNVHRRTVLKQPFLGGFWRGKAADCAFPFVPYAALAMAR